MGGCKSLTSYNLLRLRMIIYLPWTSWADKQGQFFSDMMQSRPKTQDPDRIDRMLHEPSRTVWLCRLRALLHHLATHGVVIGNWAGCERRAGCAARPLRGWETTRIQASAPVSAVVYFSAESPAEVNTAAAQREVNKAAEMVETSMQPRWAPWCKITNLPIPNRSLGLSPVCWGAFCLGVGEPL